VAPSKRKREEKNQIQKQTEMAARVAKKESAITASSTSSSSSSSSSSLSQAHAKSQKSGVESEPIYFDLTSSPDAKIGKKRVCVQTWKNRVHIHIREYYKDKNGDWKPNKKGIALKPEEFHKLVSCLPQITQAVEDRP
jgi:hypothetical protein